MGLPHHSFKDTLIDPRAPLQRLSADRRYQWGVAALSPGEAVFCCSSPAKLLGDAVMDAKAGLPESSPRSHRCCTMTGSSAAWPEHERAALQRLRRELIDWSASGQHHLHKHWQFRSCQQALDWYAQALLISERYGRHCDFYLGNVGEGRIDTDILNRQLGHLNRADLELARSLNQLELSIKTGINHTQPSEA